MIFGHFSNIAVDKTVYPLISLTWDQSTWNIAFSISYLVGVLFSVLLAVWAFGRYVMRDFSLSKFEIDQAEIGVGTSKFSFRPNVTDRQIAYAIWVELSTRKIGLPINLDHDVISEIYDSWYAFFGVTRELIKEVPVSRVRQQSTQAIIKLSIEVLNEGLRPHLTQWQARFRHWYEREMHKHESLDAKDVIDPQRIQEQFPQYDLLRADMERVNQSLIRYRKKMRELVMND